mgnify:CR=1 FL=1
MISLKELAQFLKKLRSATIFCHMRPDGDTLGSAMGLKYLLEGNGTRCKVVCESPVPKKFFFLEGMDEIDDKPDESAQAYICVDCSETHRLGTLCEAFERAAKPKFNIDHHISNSRFGDHWYVEDRAATCEIITELSAYFTDKPDARTANCLLLGLSTDTGNFAYKNVTQSTFLAAAKLVSCGGDINAIQYNMFQKQSPGRALLFGRTMSGIRYFEGGRIAFINVMKNLSVDCDCCEVAEDPCMQDIGILSSLDPVAIDQACIDLVYSAEDGQSLVNRIESRNGLHTLEHAQQIGLGSRSYELVSIDG